MTLPQISTAPEEQARYEPESRVRIARFEMFDRTPFVIERVYAFSCALRYMTDDHLFETFRTIQDMLSPMAPDADRFEEILWDSVNVEAEITSRFPEKGLDAYDEWRATRHGTWRVENA
jgi:hypothetical protein